ncbi:MAG: hypothetical protein ABEN55_09330, partial [Bradymonadaceae bacterium]
GERTGEKSDLERTGYVDFVRSDGNTHLRWIPADEQGNPDFNGAAVLEYNQWEGVFRIPKPPPTAPDQTS